VSILGGSNSSSSNGSLKLAVPSAAQGEALQQICEM
jgi:hypothetical protein